jgi:hypothetical protein
MCEVSVCVSVRLSCAAEGVRVTNQFVEWCGKL